MTMQNPYKMTSKFNFKGKEATLVNIREKVSDQQIYEFYMKEAITPGKKYLSPLRESGTPNFTFLAIGVNELLWRDWGDDSQISPLGVISFICKKFNCSYLEALSIINRDLCLGLDGVGVTPILPARTIDLPIKRDIKPAKEHKLIEVEYQVFNGDDVKYWETYGIELPQLVKYKVKPAKYVWVDGTLVRIYSRSNPVYSYNLGIDDNGKQYFKIYSPHAVKKRKWLTNAKNHIIQGLNQLAWTDYKLIITKSLKDVMLIDQMGFDSIALQSELSDIPDYLKAMLVSAYDEIYVLFDNDPVGIENSKKLCIKHEFQYVEIPDRHGAKDLSDFVKGFGYYAAETMLNKILGEAKSSISLSEGLPY